MIDKFDKSIVIISDFNYILLKKIINNLMNEKSLKIEAVVSFLHSFIMVFGYKGEDRQIQWRKLGRCPEIVIHAVIEFIFLNGVCPVQQLQRRLTMSRSSETGRSEMAT